MHYSVSSHVLSPLRHSSATAIAHHAGSWPPTTDMFGVEGPTKRNRSPQSAPIASAHNTRAGRIGPVMPTSGHNRRRLLQPITPRFAQVPHRLQGIIEAQRSHFSPADVCCPPWPTPLATAGNTVVAPDPPQTRTASARHTPPSDAHSRGHNCARSASLAFSACCTLHFPCATALAPPA
jgi:hypothetical protein